MKLIIELPDKKVISLRKCAESGMELDATHMAVVNGVPYEERKTGKWVLNQNQIDWGWDINCSVCGKGDGGFFASSRENAECKLKHQYLMDAKRRESMRYCNYCGAKMGVDE